MIIAVDGPAAAGKGTLSRRLAEALDYAWLDTGSLYRAVGLQVLRSGGDPLSATDAALASKHIDHSLLAEPDLRREDVGSAASKVAAIPEVRYNLLKFQRDFAQYPPHGKAGAVLDGRDVGTVICPDAAVKFFITASAEERAKRRTLEIEGRGEAVNYADILADVKKRDDRDMNRKDAPLKPAADAHLLDTTNLAIDAVFDRALDLVNQAKASK